MCNTTRPSRPSRRLKGFGDGERVDDLRCSRSRSPRSVWRPPWRRGAAVPGMLSTALAVGVRALARGAVAARRASGYAATCALHGVLDDACALSVVACSASARRGGGDRRSAPPLRGRRGASGHRRPAGAPAGHRTRLVACRQAPGGEPAGVRDQADLHAGPRSRRGQAGSELSDAIEAMMLAVRAWVLRFGPDHVSVWERAVCLTSGLLSGRPALPPQPATPGRAGGHDVDVQAAQLDEADDFGHERFWAMIEKHLIVSSHWCDPFSVGK